MSPSEHDRASAAAGMQLAHRFRRHRRRKLSATAQCGFWITFSAGATEVTTSAI